MIFPLNRLFFLDSQESPNKEMIVVQRQTCIAKDFFSNLHEGRADVLQAISYWVEELSC